MRAVEEESPCYEKRRAALLDGGAADIHAADQMVEDMVLSLTR